MKIGMIYDGLKYLLIGGICLTLSVFLFESLGELTDEKRSADAMDALPNYNYVPDIKVLKEQDKFSEGLDLARFVIRHPDMPGQAEAKALEEELETELTSLWGRAKRVTGGFITGSGNSIEELSGGIASDMLLYGDLRDLFKQGYYKVTDKETDPLIAALAGVGLLTELVDVIDWAPAVLKAFRKIGALSSKFADFVINAAKKSTQSRKLDGALKGVFGNLRYLVDKIGLARTSSIFKHIDDPADLASLVSVARKNGDAAYFTVKNGGPDGIGLIKRFGDTDAGIDSMAKAGKKGPAGIEWLKRGGAGRKYVLRTRFGARLIKTFRLHRPQQLIRELLKQNPRLMKALWACTILSFVAAVNCFIQSGRNFYGLRSAKPIYKTEG